MDGFSGTKCGTGLQKKWWGDKEPSDKSIIWYKGGCPFVYDASTKSWVPQSTSGGGGSLTGLALLKDFIDKTSTTELTDDTIIGFKVNTSTCHSNTYGDLLIAENPQKRYLSEFGKFMVVYDVDNSVFEPVTCTSIYSGITYFSYETYFWDYRVMNSELDSSPVPSTTKILISYGLNANGIVVPTWNWDWSKAIDYFDKTTFVYYGDLK